MFAVGSTAVIAFEDLFPQVIMSIRGENGIEHNEATRVLACTIWVEGENNFVGFTPLLIGIFHDKSNARRLNCQGLQNNSYFALSRTLIVLAQSQQEGATLLDLTLNLNMLAALAAFAFVGAILLGAF